MSWTLAAPFRTSNDCFTPSQSIASHYTPSLLDPKLPKLVKKAKPLGKIV